MKEKYSNLTNQDLLKIIKLVKYTYGFDFSGYSKASLKRRFERLLNVKQYKIEELKTKITNDSSFFDTLLKEITVNVTEMFRDPEFYKSLSKNVLPYLNSYSTIRVWNAGTSSGEELYSFAILFSENEMYKKSFFYGTDINIKVLQDAKSGIFLLKDMLHFANNYIKTGLKKPFSDYFTVEYNNAVIKTNLKENCLFSFHNLLSDGILNEFQLISCRNVLVYFDTELQNKVIKLFIDSLCLFGFLCLGSKESIRSAELMSRLKIIDNKQNIFQKIR